MKKYGFYRLNRGEKKQNFQKSIPGDKDTAEVWLAVRSSDLFPSFIKYTFNDPNLCPEHLMGANFLSDRTFFISYGKVFPTSASALGRTDLTMLEVRVTLFN